MAIRENLRDIKQDLNIAAEAKTRQLKETEVKQLIDSVLYTYFLDHLKFNKNSYTDFLKIEKKQETKEKILELLKGYEIADFKIKSYLNKTYNSILKLAKNDIDRSNTETLKNCLLRVLNNRFTEAEDIEKLYNSFLIANNRDLLAESIIAENPQFNKNEFIDFLQANYYKILKQVYNIHKQDRAAREYLQALEPIQQTAKKKKEHTFLKTLGRVLLAVLWLAGWILAIIGAAAFGWLLGMFGTAKRKK